MVRRSALRLAAGTLAWVLTGCASNRLNGLADDLRNAEVGAPVVVTEQDGSVLVTSSADYMFPSGGWQIPSDSPVLNRMVPILSKLQNTKIVVTGYTDNTPVGPQLLSRITSSTTAMAASASGTYSCQLSSRRCSIPASVHPSSRHASALEVSQMARATRSTRVQATRGCGHCRNGWSTPWPFLVCAASRIHRPVGSEYTGDITNMPINGRTLIVRLPASFGHISVG
jgi:chemotaxis protein MotB